MANKKETKSKASEELRDPKSSKEEKTKTAKELSGKKKNKIRYTLDDREAVLIFLNN